MKKGWYFELVEMVVVVVMEVVLVMQIIGDKVGYNLVGIEEH